MIPQSTTQRIKGIAILFVILSHLPRIVSFPAAVTSMLHPFGYLGVGLFLCLSGYGCAASVTRGGYNRRFVVRRIRTIIPALAACTVAMSLLHLVIFGKGFPLWEVGLNAIGLSCTIGHVTWYICFQYLCYLMLFIGGVKKKVSSLLIYFIAGVIIIVASASLDAEFIGLSMWGLNAFSFAIGVLWYAHREDLEAVIYKKRWVVMCFLIVIFVLLFAMCYFVLGNPVNKFTQNPLKSIIALTLCLVFLTAGTYFQKLFETFDICGVLTKIGNISFELFLTHGFILFVIIPGLNIDGAQKNIVFVLGTLIGTLLLKCVSKACSPSKN